MSAGQEKKYTLKEQVGFLVSGKTIALVINFTIPLIFVRLLTQEEYGLYQQFILIALFFPNILDFGVLTSLYYFFHDNIKRKNQLLSQSLFYYIVIGLLFSILLYIFKNKVINFFHNDLISIIILPTSLYIFLFLCSSIIDHIFILEQKSKHVFSFEVFNQLTRVCCLILSYVIFKSLIAVIWSLVLYAFIRLFILLFYIIRNYKINFNVSEWDKQYLRSQLKYIYPIGLGNIVGQVGARADKFILAAFFSPVDFAIYSIAKFRIPFINILYPSIANVIVPQIAKCSRNNDYHEAQRLWHKMINSFAIVTIPAIIFCFINAEAIISILFTEKYLSGVSAYRIILLTFIVQIFSRGTIPTAFGKTKIIFQARIISFLSSIVLGVLLIPPFGVNGAALTFTLTFYLDGMFQVFMAKKILKLKFREWLPWKEVGSISLYSIIPILLIIVINKYCEISIILLVFDAIVYFGIVFIVYLKKDLINLNKIMTTLKNKKL